MSPAPRKLPVIDALSGFFWISGADGHLRIQRCGACGHWQHPPLPRCPRCHSAEIAPQVVSGRGRVTSFTVNRQVWVAGLEQPFLFSVVELIEQPELYVFTNLLCQPEAARIGLPVAVTFEAREDVWVPLFRPLAAGEAAHD